MNTEGKNTSAVYGFVNSMVKVLDDEKPEYAVCFDKQNPPSDIRNFPSIREWRYTICRGRSRW